jgi:hypothetical protein
MKMKYALIGIAAMVITVAANVHAQTVQFAAVGSSAMYEEMGQAAATDLGCIWTTSSKTVVQPKDSRVGGGTLEQTTAWIAWTPGGGTCAAPGGSSVIYTYLNADSTVGNRCFFASPRCTIVVTTSYPAAGNNQLPGFTDNSLPSAIGTVVNGSSVNVAATDVRPEDSKFATERALTPCGNPIGGSTSQYLGLGYETTTTGVGTAIQGSSHQTAGNGSSFNIFDFNLMGTDPITSNSLPGTFTVTSVGAVPVVVFVNPSNESGFGSLLVTNIDRATLAGYLDGTYGRTADIINQQFASSAGGAVVYLREPVSGTYNTMEYAIPNSVESKTSQEVGLTVLAANTAGLSVPEFHCAGGVTGGLWDSTQNPLNENTTSLRGTTSPAGRYRAIGTGNMTKAVQATADSIGYAFWSAANFSAATSTNSKYLTVDGIDPIQQTWVDGLVPTSANELLGDVSLAHVKDGSYPIWSIVRLVSDTSGTGLTAATQLQSDATKFISPAQPDFVPISNLTVVRSHFAPPGVNFPSSGTNVPSNGTSTTAEAGGDVGGLVYSLQADGDYNLDNGTTTGNTGKRQ